jgi:hypothetical protein
MPVFRNWFVLCLCLMWKTVHNSSQRRDIVPKKSIAIADFFLISSLRFVTCTGKFFSFCVVAHEGDAMLMTEPFHDRQATEIF